MQDQLSKNRLESIGDPLLQGGQLKKSVIRDHPVLQGQHREGNTLDLSGVHFNCRFHPQRGKTKAVNQTRTLQDERRFSPLSMRNIQRSR